MQSLKCPTCGSQRIPLVMPHGDYGHSELYCSKCNKSYKMTSEEYSFFIQFKQQQRRK